MTRTRPQRNWKKNRERRIRGAPDCPESELKEILGKGSLDLIDELCWFRNVYWFREALRDPNEPTVTQQIKGLRSFERELGKALENWEGLDDHSRNAILYELVLEQNRNDLFDELKRMKTVVSDAIDHLMIFQKRGRPGKDRRLKFARAVAKSLKAMDFPVTATRKEPARQPQKSRSEDSVYLQVLKTLLEPIGDGQGISSLAEHALKLLKPK